MVAHAVGDIVTGDQNEPEVIVSQTSSVGGLFDSLTGSIGISSISARTKPVVAPVPASTTSGASISGSAILDAPKSFSRPIDKDALHTFISSSMPFGWYFLLWYFSSQISNNSEFSCFISLFGICLKA